MCGVCGVVDARAEVGATAELVRTMTADLERRGPDDEGRWVHEGTGAVLGFRRLAIIDPSPAGAQPMVSPDGRDALVYNGEVYNHADLRPELERAGVRFRSRSDTEVVLEGLRHWGLDGTLERLRGMFALAWYRPEEQRLVLARDHVGIKPLYWARDPAGPGIAFSSRYDSLFRTGWLDLDDLDPAVLAGFLHHRRVPDGPALHRGAAQVPPGGWVRFEPGREPETHRWWRLPEVEPDLRGDEAVEATAEVLERSVRRHLVSDVPLGVFLSGGVDSPLVAGLANRAADTTLRSFTIAVPSWDSDEGPVAARLAEPLGLDHRSRALGPPSPEDLADVVGALYEPLNDLSLLPTLAVSRFAREEVTVALSGDGGDELFFGYARVWAADAHRRLWHLPRAARRVPVGLLSRSGRLRSRAVLHEDPAAYHRAMHRSAGLDALELVAPGLGALAPDPIAAPAGLSRLAVAEAGRRADLDIQLHRILRKVDMASMHHSLEVRVPLLDPDVIATSRRIDPRWTLDQPRTKPVLRTLLDRLVPPGTAPDQKLGFSVPLGDWLTGPLAPVVEDTLLGAASWPAAVDPAGVRTVWEQHRAGDAQTILLWGLLCLAWWHSRMATVTKARG
jgi:asparagine synthase (glutamine-hydrolysing)